MSRYRTEEILRDLRSGRISEHEAESKLARNYNDGVPYGVQEVVRKYANGWVGNDVESSARKIESEYRSQELRKQIEKEKQEEMRWQQEKYELEQQRRRQIEEEEYQREAERQEQEREQGS